MQYYDQKNNIEKMEIEVPKYIMYLHPSPGTKAHKQLENLWERTKTLSQNYALQYPPHSTLTGFFHTDEIEIIAQEAKNLFKNFPRTSTRNFQIVDKKSLKYIKYSSTFLDQKISMLIQKFPHIRAPSISNLHFTLVNGIIEQDNENAKNMISNTINLKEWNEEKWCIFIWEIYCDNWKIHTVVYDGSGKAHG